MDTVIPLGSGSRNNNLELKYALRSFEKFIYKFDQLFIVGEKPDFLKDFIWIRSSDLPGASKKEYNIFHKILEAVYDERVSDDFRFFNDDHFLLKPWTDQNYYCGLLETKLAQKKLSENYRNTVANTYRAADGLWWDIHCPIIYNKAKFKNTVAKLNWNKAWGYAIKSVYCNLNNITGINCLDLKISKAAGIEQLRAQIANRLFFSTGDVLCPSMIQLLEELYPNKSRYEK